MSNRDCQGAEGPGGQEAKVTREGPVHTVINDRRIEYDAKRRGVAVQEHEASLTPSAGGWSPKEIAPLAAYLASPAAAVAGQAINVDGGVLMTG